MTIVTTSSEAQPGTEYTPAYEIRAYRIPAKVFHWLTAGLVFFMVALGVIAKQLDADPASSVLFGVHKLIGVLTFIVVLLRLAYRTMGGIPKARSQHRRPVLHWLLYGVIITVPLLGWAGVSDFGGREIFLGLSLPPIWPEGAGYDELLLHAHAYFAFALLALIALHIGVAVQDYMTDARPPAARRDD
jgi:cytochrome b561